MSSGQPRFLLNFSAHAIDPLFLVNREVEFKWLYDPISAYMTNPDETARRQLAFCVLGEKGVGKTILTRAVLHRARQQYSDRALFVEVDCRTYQTAKDVLGAIAHGIVKGLDNLRSSSTAISEELIATAQILNTITRFDEVELKVVHQHIEQFKAAANLKGERSMLSMLSGDFKISIERSNTAIKDMTGKVRFDVWRLCGALCALFMDIRASGLDVTLYLDNIDELQHHQYRIPEERQRIRRDVEALLTLRHAPIVLVLNMRTYYSGVLPREIENCKVLRRMSEAEMQLILQRRLERVTHEIKRFVEDTNAKAAIQRLASIAPTPLAFLIWFKILFEADALSVDKLAAGATTFLHNFYSTLPESVWKQVAAAFDHPEKSITHEALLTACDKNQAVVNQVIDRQGVLPKDFWDPTTYYTLDPELYLFHPRSLADQG